MGACKCFECSGRLRVLTFSTPLESNALFGLLAPVPRAANSLRYVRTHSFLKFLSKRRIIVGTEKKTVQQAGTLEEGESPASSLANLT